MAERLTRDQAAIIGLYTGISCGPFGDIHGLAEKKLGRPILTHEFASKELWERLKTLVYDDFIAICAEDRMTERKPTLRKPVNPPPGSKRVWRYLRKIDDAILFSEDFPRFDGYPEEADEHTIPDELMVDPEWFAQLPEDPGP